MAYYPHDIVDSLRCRPQWSIWQLYGYATTNVNVRNTQPLYAAHAAKRRQQTYSEFQYNVGYYMGTEAWTTHSSTCNARAGSRLLANTHVQ